MGIRYRKRIKVVPCIYVNLNKSGANTTIRIGKGINLNIGENGIYKKSSIQEIGTNNQEKNGRNLVANIGCGFITLVFIAGTVILVMKSSPYAAFAFVGAMICTFCFVVLLSSDKSHKLEESKIDYNKIIGGIDAALSKMKDNDTVKREILLAEKECLSLSQQLFIEGQKLNKLKTKNKGKYKCIIETIEANIEDLAEKLENSRYDADAGCDDTTINSYSFMSNAFTDMCKVQTAYYKTQSGKEISIAERPDSLGFIRCSCSAPAFRIDDNPLTAIYLYPQFAIVYKIGADFEIFLTENQSIDAKMQDMGWVKTYPFDCEIINQSYLHSTKDGKRDLRYSNNPLLYHILYGSIKFSFLNGLLYVSNPKSCQEFAGKYANFIGSTNVGNREELSKYESHNDDALKVADKLFAFSKQANLGANFLEELNKICKKIVINNEKGAPLLGEDGKFRCLFLYDISYCYGKMSTSINLESKEGNAIMYLLAMLLFDGYNNTTVSKSNYIDIVKTRMSNSIETMVRQLASGAFKDGEDDLVVAALLHKCDDNLRTEYLVLLYRFFSIIAKTDGNITEKEQNFLNHILHLQGKSKKEKASKAITKGNNPMDELNKLVGLESVKQDVRSMSNFIKMQLSRNEQGLKASPMSYHCVFTGNPGTGKTTVARILSAIYSEMGILKKGHLVETDRSGLVAEYVGQTAVKTNNIIDSALDGILFIDEAYSLSEGGSNDYGKEAISTLLKRMEDDRDRLVVIIAGYGDEIKHFVDTNPGLQSRFNRYIHFPDYSASELHQIFCSLAQKYDYELDEMSSSKILSILTNAVDHKDKNFGNGRFVRNLFEKTLECQANRLATIPNPSLADLRLIKAVDCESLS